MTVQAEGIHHWSGWRHSRPQRLVINKPLSSLSPSTNSVCWLFFINCSDIHAREHKIQLRKPLGSFQACLDCRTAFTLQSSTGCAVHTSAAWMCLQKCGQSWANRWSAQKDFFLIKLCFCFSKKKLTLMISAPSLPPLPHRGTSQSSRCSFPLLLCHNHCVSHSLWSFVQETMEEKKALPREHSLHRFL